MSLPHRFETLTFFHINNIKNKNKIQLKKKKKKSPINSLSHPQNKKKAWLFQKIQTLLSPSSTLLRQWWDTTCFQRQGLLSSLVILSLLPCTGLRGWSLLFFSFFFPFCALLISVFMILPLALLGFLGENEKMPLSKKKKIQHFAHFPN